MAKNKTFRLAMMNTFYVEVEAKDEEQAEKKMGKLIAKDYNYPMEHDDYADGWEIESIEEVD